MFYLAAPPLEGKETLHLEGKEKRT